MNSSRLNINWRQSDVYTVKCKCKCIFLAGISFARSLYTFGKKSEHGRRMIGEKFERMWVDYYNLIVYKSASLSFHQLCLLNTLQNFDFNVIEHYRSSLLRLTRIKGLFWGPVFLPYICLLLVLLMLLKTLSPMVSTFLPRYLIILWINPCEIWTKDPKTCTL